MDIPARFVRFDGYVVDTVQRQLRHGDRALPLTSKAFDLLCVLITRRDEVVSKNILMDEVWPGSIVEENNLCQAIASLRRALGTDAHDHRFILTVPRRGYRFVADLHPRTASHATVAAPPSSVFDASAAERALRRARFRLHQRDHSAPRAFLDAIRLDPANAEAYAGLAQSYLFLAHQDARPAEVFPLARAAASEAMHIDPDSATVRLAHARVLQLVEWAWDDAEADLRTALALAPDLAETHCALAHVLVTTGRIDEGLAAVARARALAPLSPLVNTLEGGFLSAAGDTRAARAALERALALEPDFWVALTVRAGLALDEGNAAAAVADLDRAADVSGRLTPVLATLAEACVAQGARSRAMDIHREMAVRARTGHVPALHRAAVLLALGSEHEALSALDDGLDERDIRMVFLGIDARWNPLRSQSRFHALTRALRLPNGPACSRL